MPLIHTGGRVAATGSQDFTVPAVLTNTSGHEVVATVTAGQSYGIAGAFWGKSSAPTGTSYGVAIGHDISGVATGSVMAGLDIGVKGETGGDLSAVGYLVGLQIMTQSLGVGPTTHCMMRFNTNESGNAPTHWFYAANQKSVAYVINTAHGAANTDKVGAIKVHIVGVGDTYLYVFDHPGQ